MACDCDSRAAAVGVVASPCACDGPPASELQASDSGGPVTARTADGAPALVLDFFARAVQGATQGLVTTFDSDPYEVLDFAVLDVGFMVLSSSPAGAVYVAKVLSSDDLALKISDWATLLTLQITTIGGVGAASGRAEFPGRYVRATLALPPSTLGTLECLGVARHALGGHP